MVRSVSWVRVPPVKGTGDFATNKNPTVVTSVGNDGVLVYTDIIEQTSYTVNRTTGGFIELLKGFTY